MSEKQQWGSKLGVILAVAGSAVGLGNFLRFPGKAAENGGGAFMIPYFIALLLVGIPLCWAEWSMGRYGGRHGFNSAPGIFATLWRHPAAKYLGALALLVPMTVYFYYIVIESWCLGYAFYYLMGWMNHGSDPAKYKAVFEAFTGSSKDGAILSGLTAPLIFLAITFVVNFLLVYRGLSGGIEKFCNIAMPLMAICAICVLARVLTLPANPNAPNQNVVNGLGYLWNPDFSVLGKPGTWLAAAGQIFFTLSVGFGVIINYASYCKPKQDIALSSLTASSVNEFFEVCLGGLITIPAAFIFLGAAALTQFTSSSFSLGFNALPNVFAEMPAGSFFGFLWFFMLFLAAITSSISMLQPVLAFFEEGLGWNRMRSTVLLFALSLIGTGWIVLRSGELKGLSAIDYWSGEMFIVVLALVQAILYGWVFGIQKGKAELDSGAQLQVPAFVQFVIRYVSPLFLIWILISQLIARDAQGKLELVKKFEDPVLATGFGIVAGCMVLLLVLVSLASKRWKQEGRSIL
jgi:SNF family Na+-dependent transporter